MALTTDQLRTFLGDEKDIKKDREEGLLMLTEHLDEILPVASSLYPNITRADKLDLVEVPILEHLQRLPDAVIAALVLIGKIDFEEIEGVGEEFVKKARVLDIAFNDQDALGAWIYWATLFAHEDA